MSESEKMMELVYQLIGASSEQPINKKCLDKCLSKLQNIANMLDHNIIRYLEKEIYRLQSLIERDFQWISVTDKLPEDNYLEEFFYDVWVRGKHSTIPYGRIPNVRYSKDMGWNIFNLQDGLRPIMGVTHWMPLPQPPKDK